MNSGKLGALTMALAVALTGCESGLAGNDVSSVRLLLTDAPGDFASAEVTISEIYLQGSDGAVTLFDGPATYDLLDLQNGVTAELAEIIVPSGSYSELRMVVESAEITTNEGRTFSTTAGTLQCPSCGQSGIKVKLPGGAVQLEGESEIVLIDFDVAQSFGRQAGNSGRWVMHPVIHASDFTTASVIRGTVALADGVTLPASCGGHEVTLAHFVPTATSSDLTVSGRTAANGDFRFSFVAPGSYTLGFEETISFDSENLTFTATVDPATLNVGASDELAATYTITGAACAAAS